MELQRVDSSILPPWNFVKIGHYSVRYRVMFKFLLGGEVLGCFSSSGQVDGVHATMNISKDFSDFGSYTFFSTL